MKTKKAQGISINTIIIAAIALIVLVVLIAIFTGRLSIWGRGLDEQGLKTCSDLDGAWFEKEDCLSNGGKIIPGFFKDSKDHILEVCCG